MTIELRSIHEYPESDGWEIHWKSQSFETAREIRDSNHARAESTRRRYRRARAAIRRHQPTVPIHQRIPNGPLAVGWQGIL